MRNGHLIDFFFLIFIIASTKIQNKPLTFQTDRQESVGHCLLLVLWLYKAEKEKREKKKGDFVFFFCRLVI